MNRCHMPPLLAELLSLVASTAVLLCLWLEETRGVAEDCSKADFKYELNKTRPDFPNSLTLVQSLDGSKCRLMITDQHPWLTH